MHHLHNTKEPPRTFRSDLLVLRHGRNLFGRYHYPRASIRRGCYATIRGAATAHETGVPLHLRVSAHQPWCIQRRDYLRGGHRKRGDQLLDTLWETALCEEDAASSGSSSRFGSDTRNISTPTAVTPMRDVCGTHTSLSCPYATAP